MARLISLVLVIGLLPNSLAGPACASKYKQVGDCIQMCGQKWGWPGMMMGTDAWGSVMRPSTDSMSDYIASACGEQSATSSVASTSTSASSSATEAATKLIHGGLATEAVTTSSSTFSSTSSSTTSSSVTSTSISSTSTHTTISSKTTTSSTSTQKTTTSSSTTSTTSTTHTTPPATTSKPPPPPPKTTSTTSSTTQQQTTTSTAAAPTKTAAQLKLNSANTSNAGNANSSNNGGGNGSRASNADVQAYLTAHNSIRSQHGAVPVAWSNAAASKAQFWADKCTNTHSGGTLGPLGENLAAGTGSFPIADAVKAWTDEVSDFDPNNPKASHFTQVVWKASTQIGCAVQTCPDIFPGFGSAQYYVCEYSVQGNVEGEFGANVQK